MTKNLYIIFALVLVTVGGYSFFNFRDMMIDEEKVPITDFVVDVKNGNISQPLPASSSPSVSPTPSNVSAQVSVITDSAKERQIIEGFGATHQSLVYGGGLGDTLTPSQRSRAVDAIFNQVKITTGQIPTIFEASASSNLSTFFENQANDNNGDVSINTGDIVFDLNIKNGPINFGSVVIKGCCDIYDPGDGGDGGGNNGGGDENGGGNGSNPGGSGGSSSSSSSSGSAAAAIGQVLGLSATSGEFRDRMTLMMGFAMLTVGFLLTTDSLPFNFSLNGKKGFKK